VFSRFQGLGIKLMPVPQVMSPSVDKMCLQYIRPRHREIARLLACGATQTQLCERFGYTAGRLSIIVNSPLMKLEIDKYEKMRDGGVAEVFEELERIAPVALENIEKVMLNSESERLRFEASKDLLDRAGVGVKKGITINTEGDINISPVDLAKYKPVEKKDEVIDITPCSFEPPVPSSRGEE
jgi:hypothetical protein